jgi:hypothetical protein
MSALGMPNHVASVLPIWSTPVVGSHAPLLPGVVRPAQHQRRVRAVHVAALHRAAHHHVVAAVRMVGAERLVADERAVEVRHRERRDVVRDAGLDRVVVERAHRRPDLAEQVVLVGQDVRVRVPPADVHHEELALDAQRRPRLDQARDLLELVGEPGVEQRAVDRERVGDQLRQRRRQERVRRLGRRSASLQDVRRAVEELSLPAGPSISDFSAL